MTYNHNPYGNYPSRNVERREEEANKVPSGFAKEILAWVGDDKDRAERALAAEEEGQQRKTLIKDLKEIIDG